MVIIWLMMVNNNLLGAIPTPLKNDGRIVSWDGWKFPAEWKVIKFHGSSHHQPDNGRILDDLGYLPIIQ